MAIADGDHQTHAIPPDRMERIAGLQERVAELERTCRTQQKAVALLDAIRKAQSLYIIDANPLDIYQMLLKTLVEISDSEYGFLDEVVRDAEGNILKKNLAISNISWDEPSRKLYEQLQDRNLTFSYLDNLAGLPALTGEIIISNNPGTDHRSKGVPEGHPPVRSFLGMPLYFGGKLVCVAGVANREGGYSPEIATFLDPLLSTCAGITYAIKRERLLQKSEARYRTLFRNAPLGIFRSTFNGRFLEVNPALAQMLGFDSPRAVIDAIHSIGDQVYCRPERRREIVSEQREAREFTCHVNRLRRRDGSEFIANLYIKTVRDGQGDPLYLEGIVEDITERIMAEQALVQSRKRFQTVADFTYDWEYWVGPDGRFIYVSPSCKRITGHDPMAFMRNPHLMDQIVHPADRDAISSHGVDGDPEHDFHAAEFRITTRGGEVRWIGHVCRPVFDRDDNGRYLGRRGSNRDITHHKRLQRESIQSQRMEAIGTLAGGIAHQFNNALSVIMGHLELIAEDYPDLDPLNAYTRSMNRSAERMKHLTAQLLAYARGGKYQAAPVSMADFLTVSLPIVRHAVAPAVMIDTDFPAEDLTVKIDQTQLQMVLAAVLANASEALEGAGDIRIRLRRAAAVEGSESDDAHRPAPGDYACIAVTDNGKGMDDAIRSRIFEPFFTTKFEGRGLGMAAAFGIVKNHGGAITVTSKPGAGTTVTICLPLVEPGSGPDSPPEMRAEADTTEEKGTVLVIDDEERVVKVCRAMLGRMGFHVLEATSGAEAISVLRADTDRRIDLALLDLLIPDISGDHLYPILKEIRPDLKVIVITGYALDGSARNVLSTGADGFIQKPFTKTDLAGKIQTVLNHTKGEPQQNP